jgi:hypothetical protein
LREGEGRPGASVQTKPIVHRTDRVIGYDVREVSNVDPTKMTQDEFLCAKDLTREPAPNADATSAKLIGATILEQSKIKSFGLYLVLRTCGDFRIIRLNDTDTGLMIGLI